MTKKRFPKEIAVSLETDCDPPYFMVHTEPAAAAELHREVHVGIYQLVREAIVTTKAEVR